MTATEKAVFVAVRYNYIIAVFGDPEVEAIMTGNESDSGSNKAGTLTITKNMKDDVTGDVKFELNGYEVSLPEASGAGAAKLYGTFTVSGNIEGGKHEKNTAAYSLVSRDLRICLL